MRRGRSTTLLLGGVLALLTAIVLFMVLSAGNSGTTTAAQIPPTPVPKIQVLVVVTDTKGFMLLKDSDVMMKDVEASQVVTSTARTASTVVGKVLIRDYKAQTQINLLDVTDPGISQMLKKGERGFVLPIAEVNNFGGQLLDHDSVDVFWTRVFEINQALVGPDGKPTSIVKQLPTTKKILDNIRILHVIQLSAGTAKASTGAVNAQPQDPNAGTSGSSSQDTAAQAQAKTAATQAAQGMYAKDAPPTAALVLAITDQQAEVIKFAREYGVVDLALRAKDDTEVVRTTGITDKIMNEDYGVVLPELIVK